MARNPSHFGSNSQPSPSGSAEASLASMGSMGGSMGKGMRTASSAAPAARRDPALRRGPSGVERTPRRVEVDDQRRVVGGDGLALARLAVDLRPDRAALERGRDEQVVDAH